MKAMKIWQLQALIFSGFLYGFITGVEFRPCIPAVRNEPCNMTCQVPDFLQLININCNGTSRGSCAVFGCGTGMVKEGTNAVFQIQSLSYTRDTCEWTCTHQSDTSSPVYVTVSSGIFGLNLTGQKDADGIKLIGTAECLYPSNPTVIIQYKEEGGIYVNLTGQQVYLQSSHIPGACSFDIENRTTAFSDVSGQHTELEGKNVYFRMGFSHYNSDFIFSSGVGPFSFVALIPSVDCSLDIFLYGFLPDFLIVLIVSIVIIIILKIECLPKQFGGLTWKKLGIIAVCFVVAIIIGVCLGLLIKGCDNKFLALALSLLFGSLLVVALILALIYYHKKKFESRRDIQDGGAQDGNGSSQNNTGSNTTRTTTERVGNKAGVPKGEQSALKQKEINTPLPLPPSGNSQYLTASTNNLPVSRNKLDPIVMENEEPNPSERKKKKRKKKKRKNEKNVDEAGDNED